MAISAIPNTQLFDFNLAKSAVYYGEIDERLISDHGGNEYGGIIGDPESFYYKPNPDYWIINAFGKKIEIDIRPIKSVFNIFENIGKLTVTLANHVPKVIDQSIKFFDQLIETSIPVFDQLSELTLDVMGELPGLIKFFLELLVNIIRGLRDLIKNPTLLIVTSISVITAAFLTTLAGLSIAIKIWKMV